MELKKQPVAAATGRRWADSEKLSSRTHGAENNFSAATRDAPPTGKGATPLEAENKTAVAIALSF